MKFILLILFVNLSIAQSSIVGGGSRTLTLAGLSTNARMLSDQNGTGVTVTQFTNY